jgi:hypothetical protein
MQPVTVRLEAFKLRLNAAPVQLFQRRNPRVDRDLLHSLLLSPASSTASFSLALSPTTLTLRRGWVGTVTITLGSQGGFKTLVALSHNASGALSGTYFVGATSVAPPGTATLNVVVSRRASIGTYQITVTGVGGGITRSATVTVVVR